MRLLQPSSPQPFLFPSCPVFTAAIFSAANFVHFMSRVFCSRLHRRLFFSLHVTCFLQPSSLQQFCSLHVTRLLQPTSPQPFFSLHVTCFLQLSSPLPFFFNFMSRVYCSRLHRSHFCSLHVLCLLQPSSPQPFLFTSCHAFTAAVFTAAIFSLHLTCFLQPSSPQPFLFTSCHVFSAAVFTAAILFTSCHVFSATVLSALVLTIFLQPASTAAICPCCYFRLLRVRIHLWCPAIFL